VTDDKVHFNEPFVCRDFNSVKASPSATTAKTPPINLKVSLQCLGIVLFELLFGKPIEEWKYKVQLRPLNSSDSSNLEFRLAIANKFHSEEITAEDPSFAGPIENCLHFHNTVGLRKRSVDEIIDEIYLSVSKPLQDELANKWTYIGNLTY
jgi:hypothetical protein